MAGYRVLFCGESSIALEVAMNAGTEYRKKQFFGMVPEEILSIIRGQFSNTQNTLGYNEALYEGLCAAVRERPHIAVAICPALVESGEHYLLNLFMDLLFDLWRANEPLMIALLHKAKQGRDRRLLADIEDVLESYKAPGGKGGSTEDFGIFLAENGF